MTQGTVVVLRVAQIDISDEALATAIDQHATVAATFSGRRITLRKLRWQGEAGGGADNPVKHTYFYATLTPHNTPKDWLPCTLYVCIRSTVCSEEEPVQHNVLPMVAAITSLEITDYRIIQQALVGQ